MSKIVKRKSIKLVLLLLLFIFLGFIFFAGQFLVIDQAPEKADVIIVLGGANYRVKYGSWLYNNGYANLLIYSGVRGENAIKMANQLGVPQSAIIYEQQAESTYENALFSKDIMIQKGFNSAIVVSSDWHMRRVKLTYEKEFYDMGNIKLYYCASNDPDFDSKLWWINKKSFKYTVTEYIKLAGYFVTKRL
ncbi:MAG: hypothetical protein JL50_01800 [Peptococcaceae bacterium BICA1-7]|nr:MAG: hypothetical protein JL50_11440 [Peptococcaceae bacterium BICA1-7]KJS69457.1 MAG: hypothetical protein JL50_01800 [Peptococcaceae bacterium BICA1-7]